MNRTCKCGGIIRENGKPFWDILPSCTCQNPTMTENSPVVITTTGTTNLPQDKESLTPSSMVQKRIHNASTGKYYAIRQRTTSKGKKGQTRGVYKSIKKNYGNAIKRLGSI